MAKTKISEYDSTAANNTDIDSINIAEGCAPSGINNAIRELMAHLKDMNIGSTITMLNTTEEDGDGGRANKIIFKGEQSGGEESVLAEIQASHDGTADDQKGDLIFRTNDGADGTSPTERMRINSSGIVTIGDSNAYTYGGGLAVATASGSHITVADTGSGERLHLEGGSGSTAVGSKSNHDLRFITNDTERMRILSGGGLTFNGDTAAANALDDYEEGEHNPTVTCSNSGSITLNGSFATLSYTKVGRLVSVSGLLIVGAISSPNGNINITMPFVPFNGTHRSGDSSGSVLVTGSTANCRDYVTALNEQNNDFQIYLGDAGAIQPDSANAMQVGTQIYLNIVFHV